MPKDTLPKFRSMRDLYDIPKEYQKNWLPLFDSLRGKQVLTRRNHDRGLEIYPGVFSTDRDFLKFMSHLRRELMTRFPMEIYPDGTCKDGIASKFSKLGNVAGVLMTPTSIPAEDNTHLRNLLGLVCDHFKNDEHREIAESLFSCMFEYFDIANLHLNRLASMGPPIYSNDIILKKQLLLKCLKEHEQFLRYIDNGNLDALMLDYNAPLVYLIGERVQPDSMVERDGVFSPKPRLVNTEAYSRGLDDNGRIIADKSVRIDGLLLDEHCAMRRRNVWGHAFVCNYALATYMNFFRAHYLSEYHFTWKHRSLPDIADKIDKWKYFAGFDVTNFDTTVPQFLIDYLTDKFSEVLDPRVAKMMKLMCHAPFIAQTPTNAPHDIIVTNPFHGIDPFNVDTFKFNYGLPSGIACNPDFGKFFMMFQYLVLMNDLCHDVLKVGVDRILRGDHDRYAFLNMGDDCVVLMNDERLYKSVISGKYKTDYFKVEPESPISFLGGVIYREGNKTKVAPNLETYFANWLCPEKGIDHYARKNFWAVGEFERTKYYASAPCFKDAYDLMNSLFTKYVGKSIPTLVDHARLEQLELFNLSPIDMLVLQNPGYLHYRFTEDDISEQVRDILVTSLEGDELFNFIKPYMRARRK